MIQGIKILKRDLLSYIGEQTVYMYHRGVDARG
jgi:hypothetical protein